MNKSERPVLMCYNKWGKAVHKKASDGMKDAGFKFPWLRAVKRARLILNENDRKLRKLADPELLKKARELYPAEKQLVAKKIPFAHPR